MQGTADRRFPGFPIIEQHKISVQFLGYEDGFLLTAIEGK
jgi:hypothetical protein